MAANELPVMMEMKYSNCVLFDNHCDNLSSLLHSDIDLYNWYTVKNEGMTINMMDSNSIVNRSDVGYSGRNEISTQKNASDKLSLKCMATANNELTL